MSRQVRKAKKFVRGRRFLTAAFLTMVVVGLGTFAGTSFVANATTATINGDTTCGYGGTTQFTESTVMNWAQVNGNGLGATFSAYANDENSILLGVNGATGMAGNGATSPQHMSEVSGGDPSQVLPDGQPYYPSLYLTKVSGPGSWTKPGDPTPVEPGDFQQGGSSRDIAGLVAGNTTQPAGTPYVNDVFGTWVTGTISAANNGSVGTLTNTTPLSTTTNTTSLQVGGGTTQAIKSGDSIVLSQSGHTQTFKASANVAAGATSIPVSGQKANFGYSNGASAVDSNLVAAAGKYTKSYIPTKNDNVFGPGSDAPTNVGGASALHDEGYGSEFRWNVNGLSALDPTTHNYAGLQPGAWYKVQVLDNDGDQNKTGGDTGEFCTLIKIPGPPPLVTDTTGQTDPSVVGPGHLHIKEPLGSVIKDSAFVSPNSGFPNPTGSVKWRLFFNPSGSGLANSAVCDSAHEISTSSNPADASFPDTEPLTVSSTPGNPSVAVSMTHGTSDRGLGTYVWQAQYLHGSDPNYTDGEPEACGTETDTMVQARIRLTPNEAVNIVGNDHVITAHVETTEDGTNYTVVAGAHVVTSLVNNSANAVYDPASANTCDTGAGGTCTVTIISSTVGSVDVHATSTFTATGVIGSLTASTGAHSTGDDTTDARKTYINPKTQLTVQDRLIGLDASMTGSVTYTAFGTLADCQAGTNGTAGGTFAVTNGVAPISNSFTVNPGETLYFVAHYSGTGGTLDTSCTAESASSS